MADLPNDPSTSKSSPKNEDSVSTINLSSFQETFNWDWYIRIKLASPTYRNIENLNELSAHVQELWQRISIRTGEAESQLWPEILQDSSIFLFRFIGLPNLPSRELASCKKYLREWLKRMKSEADGASENIEAKFIPRKVFLQMNLETYNESEPQIEDPESKRPRTEFTNTMDRGPSEKHKATSSPSSFKKIKGSNPSQIRRQFLQHTMQDTSPTDVASSSITDANSSTSNLRPGKEILNRLKFDASYDVADFVVGYIDRKAGIIEKNVDHWAEFGEEELMAYVKNVKVGEIVWDKARKIDLVSGRKGN